MHYTQVFWTLYRHCAPQVAPGLRAPLLMFTYYNPIMARGADAFCRQAKEAGVSGGATAHSMQRLHKGPCAGVMQTPALQPLEPFHRKRTRQGRHAQRNLRAAHGHKHPSSHFTDA